jgi:hypothetical protein
VYPDEEIAPFSPLALRAYLFQTLPRVPLRICAFADTFDHTTTTTTTMAAASRMLHFPRTSSGKLDKRKLERLWNQHQDQHHHHHHHRTRRRYPHADHDDEACRDRANGMTAAPHRMLSWLDIEELAARIRDLFVSALNGRILHVHRGHAQAFPSHVHHPVDHGPQQEERCGVLSLHENTNKTWHELGGDSMALALVQHKLATEFHISLVLFDVV